MLDECLLVQWMMGSGEQVVGTRGQAVESHGRSEFSYGAFARSLPLPAGADVDDVHATYERGILAISVPHDPEPRPPPRVLPVRPDFPPRRRI